MGEVFFVPAPGVDPPVTLVLFDEPLSLGRGKLHLVQFAYRCGPDVFAKGAIRHPDHATIVLRGWHRVATSIEPGHVTVAQPVERSLETRGGAGSNPAGHIARPREPGVVEFRRGCSR